MTWEWSALVKRTVEQYAFIALLICLLASSSWAGERAMPAAAAPSLAASLPMVQNVSKLLGDPKIVSASGSEIELIEFKAAPSVKPEAKGRGGIARFLIQGGLHGNEEQASAFVVWVARRYARGESMLNQLPSDQVAFDFVPFANPDGSHGHTRYNARGVNLNRNFGVLWGITRENPGAKSFSEPETQAIRRLFKERHYTAAVDVHGYINWIVSPSGPADVMKRGIKPTATQKLLYGKWVDGIQREMQLLPGYQLKNGALLGDGGAFEDWAFWSEGTLAYCLELETIQRFVPSYRPDFNDLKHQGAEASVDLFKRYEMFVYRTFANALKIKQDAGLLDSLANSN